MFHEDITGGDVAPSPRRRTEREVVLLSIAPSESSFVEESGVVDRRSADEHAEAHSRGHVDNDPCVGLGAEIIKILGGVARRKVVVDVTQWQAEDCGSIGERGDGADVVG